jgi:hypothetical protein
MFWLQGGKDVLTGKPSPQGERTVVRPPAVAVGVFPLSPPEVTKDPKAQADFERNWWNVQVGLYEKQLDQAKANRASLIRAIVAFGRHNARVDDWVTRLESGDGQATTVDKMRELLSDVSDGESMLINKLTNDFISINEHINSVKNNLERAKAFREDALRRLEERRVEE